MKTYRTVKVVMIDKERNILLLQRSKTHPTQSLQMDLPGGFIESGEQPADTLIREVKEETGLQLDIDRVKLAYAEAGESEGQNAVRLVYVTQLSVVKPSIALSWEHIGFEWVKLSAAIQKLDPKKYKNRALVYLTENNILEDL